MSELKITISQLENLLDRQKDIISETLLDNENCEEVSQGVLLKGTTITELMYRKIPLCNYPEEFNILKKYVK